MNRIDFDQVGGYRLETQTFSEMQKNYNLMQALGEVLGKRAIVKGCVVSGSTVSDGVIYWDGELIEFKGGNVQSRVVIVQTVENILFLDGNQKPTFYRRHATFGTGLNSVPWSDFKRTFPLSSALFIDEIRMYAGAFSDIPFGWHLANGTNGTVDLRDRFIVGFNPDNPDYNTIGSVGGETEVTLTVEQMPKHGHAASTDSGGGHTHSVETAERDGGYGKFTGGSGTSEPAELRTNSAGDHTHRVTVSTTGGGLPHENRPPYFTLAFIQFKNT